MPGLEQRYRRVLRLLPASYRRVREDDMVVAFLQRTMPEDAEDAAFTAEHGWPSGAEVARVATLGIRLRLGSAGASPRYVAWGAAVRRVALVGLLAHTVLGLVNVAMAVWFSWFPPLPPEPAVQLSPANGWWTMSIAVEVLWAAAYVALVCGYRRAARVPAVAVLAFSVVSFYQVPVLDGVPLLVETCWLLAAALPVFALAAFHSESPPVRPRPWLVALPVGLVLTAILFIHPTYLGYPLLVDLPGFACLLAAVAGMAYLAAPGLRWGGPEASWPAALALLGFGALGLRVVTLVEYLQVDGRTDDLRSLIVVGVVEAALTVAVSVMLVVVAGRALRAMPNLGGRGGTADAVSGERGQVAQPDE